MLPDLQKAKVKKAKFFQLLKIFFAICKKYLLTSAKYSHSFADMKIKQKHVCKRYGISPATVSLALSGKRPVSWPLAVKLSEDFPAKTTQQWKEATPEELRRAFAQLQNEKKVQASLSSNQ
jgi:plasmid maintenance system antidote protein VapI